MKCELIFFNIFRALAQFELRMIHERTSAGLAVTGARGRFRGRPRVESEEAKKLANDDSLSIDDICKTLKIYRSTYYRYLAMDAAERPSEDA